MFKNIQIFKNAAAVISELKPATFWDLSDEETSAITHVDDFEFFDYLVFDGSRLIVIDRPSGDVIQEFNTIDEFIAETLEYIRAED